MIRFNLGAPLLLLIACLLFPASSRAVAQQSDSSTNGVTDTTDERNRLELETFSLINDYRKAHALPALQWDDVIAKIARGHSRDMAGGGVEFGHDGFSERVTRIKDALPGLRGAGENVLRTDNPDQVARLAVDVWLKSPHHLKNIRGDFNYSGLGIWVDAKGIIYFTQIFIKTEPQMQEAQAPPAPQVASPFGLLASPQTR